MKSLSFKIQSLVALVKSRSFRLVPISLASAVLLGLAARPSQAAVLLSESFKGGDGGFTVNTPIAYDGPWVYSAGTGSWTEAGQNPEDGHLNNSSLISPAILVPQAGEVQLTFSHRYSFEAGQWDGGQVRISVNGGDFTAVPVASFTQNGYNGVVLTTSQSALAGQSAFTENSPDFANTKVTSICTLGSFKAGDSIQVAFLAANDTNTRGQFQPNWEIDSVTVASLSTVALPTLNCSTNIVAECTGGLTPVSFTVTASDDSGPLAVTCTPPSGSGFRLGTTNVLCTVSNAAGTNTCTFSVTVVDTTPPHVTCPSNIVTAATGPGGAVVSYTASASDVCGIASFDSSPSSGSTFPVGTTTVTSTATDSTGNSNSCSFSVTVTPTLTLPTLNCATNIVAECTGGLTPVSFTVTASDESGPLAVTCTPPSGSGFRLGTTNVLCTVSNAAGTNTCTFAVTVVDTTPPRVTCPSNIVTAATGPGGAVVSYTASASDTCGIASFDSSPSSGSTFPVGTTTVTSIATDITGNSNSCSFSVTVTSTNGCPVANPTNVAVNLGGQVNFQLVASDPDGNSLQFQVTQVPAHGTVVVEQTGAAAYSPTQDYCGPDSFKFRVSDGQCNSTDAVVSITVNCPNECPTAVASVTPTLSASCIGLSNVVVAADNIAACVVLNGSESSDPDPDDALTYSWTVDGRFNIRMDGSQDGGGARMGAGIGTVALSDNTLTINITFSGLSAGATAAHIHGPAAPGVNAAVLYPLNSITTLGGTAGTITGAVALVEGTGGFTLAQQLQQLREGNWYINIHNATFPGGEIRGQLLATVQGAVVTNCLPIGSHEVCLTVSDGRCSDTKCVTVEVITPCQAVGTLVLGVESSTLPRNRQQPLTAALKTACAAFERGGQSQGVNHLQRFQNKVSSQVQPVDAALAQQLIDCAQSIIDSVGGP